MDWLNTIIVSGRAIRTKTTNAHTEAPNMKCESLLHEMKKSLGTSQPTNYEQIDYRVSDI